MRANVNNVKHFVALPDNARFFYDCIVFSCWAFDVVTNVLICPFNCFKVFHISEFFKCVNIQISVFVVLDKHTPRFKLRNMVTRRALHVHINLFSVVHNRVLSQVHSVFTLVTDVVFPLYLRLSLSIHRFITNV